MWIDAPWKPRRWQEKALPVAIQALKAGNRPVISAIMGAGKSVLIAELVYQALKKLHPDYKIVVVAPRQNLIRQLSKTISIRCGAENVGVYYAQEKDISKKVVVTTFVSTPTIAKSIKVAMMIGDEVHGTEGEHFKVCYEDLAPSCAIGFTATPYRSNENETLSLWDEVIYRYTAADALADGVIVPWRLHHWDGKGSSDVDQVCHRLIQKMDGPGVVSALDIEDAKAYATYLNENGIKAAAIHSRMKQDERDRLIKMLEKGAIRCLVHVSLLAEGVDLPWLRWICLRRPVGARVRFVQEVGRVLRSHPNKDIAHIIDPHDLFGVHCLSNPERLGEALSKEEKEYEDELVKLEPDQDKREEVRKMPPAKAFGQIDSYVSNLLSVLRSARVCDPPSTWEEERWRGGSPSAKQLETVTKLKWASRYLPKEIRESVKLIIEKASSFNKGTVSDLLSILFGLSKSSSEARKNKTHYFLPSIRYPRPDFAIQTCLFVMENN